MSFYLPNRFFFKSKESSEGFRIESLNFLKLRDMLVYGVDPLFIDFIFQDLIDKARTTLVGNRNLLQHMQAPMGIPVTSDSDDPAFANFNQVSLHFFPQFQAVSV